MEKAGELQNPERSERKTEAVGHQENVMSASWCEEPCHLGWGRKELPDKSRGDE